MKKTRRARAHWIAWLAPWRRHLLIAAGTVVVVTVGAFGYFYVHYGRIIDARLHGERDRVVPRVFARPITLQAGEIISPAELVARLNDVGYAQRARIERPGEFAVDRNIVTLIPRGGDRSGQPVRVSLTEPRSGKGPAPPATARSQIVRVQAGDARVASVTLEPPLLTALVSGAREKRRRVALDTIPSRMQQAVLAIEDRRFYLHPGVDPIRMVGALVTNLVGDRPYLVGASTITQQLARNFFLTEEMAVEQQTRQRTVRRKLQEQVMAIILETKATKDEILELYLNDVYLGNRGSFALHGVAEAARMFFGKDISNVSLAEAALIAGVIQSPFNHSPFNSLERAKDRRDVVLRAMADAGYVTPDAATRASKEPVTVVARALDNEAPYFVDYLGQALDTSFPGITAKTGALDVYTTLDLSLQRYAQDAMRDGLAKVDAVLARRKRGPKRVAQAALIAIDPRTGDILSLIGGRSYNQSQFNRAFSARRQPGSTFKPFVYLAAFERAAEEGLADLTPATMVWDEPTTWTFDAQEWSPHNYDDDYDGHITIRRALAMSRNIATIKVAEQAGFDRVASLWKRTRVGDDNLRGYPSIALGVFELTPLEVAEAYTLFPNGGTTRPLRAITSITSGERRITPPRTPGAEVARPATTFLVTNLMRGVINEGTGATARTLGFGLDAAAKTGTTNDLRDAWFIGFTPELLTVVWVGLDDNQPLGLSGAQAALPIWTAFMMKALAGHPNIPFAVPDGLTFVDIDRDTGKRATPECPRVVSEAFLAGTEPLEVCPLHRF